MLDGLPDRPKLTPIEQVHVRVAHPQHRVLPGRDGPVPNTPDRKTALHAQVFRVEEHALRVAKGNDTAPVSLQGNGLKIQADRIK